LLADRDCVVGLAGE